MLFLYCSGYNTVLYFSNLAVDVRELFPEFRHDSVLRFSRLFPIKSSHKPKIWKIGKKKRKDVENAEEENENLSNESSSRNCGFQLNYAPFPEDPDAYLEDGVVQFHKFKEEKQEEEETTQNKQEEKKGPKPTDWRFGPAQYWYKIMLIIKS